MSFGKKLEFVTLGVSEISVFAVAGDRAVRMSTMLDELEIWCKENDCGVRLSFNAFRFRDDKERMLFLLRWS
jgi:hypothetical protein